MAASALPSLRGGSGRRTFPPNSPGRSAANATSRSGLRESARMQPVTARLNGSVGDSLDVDLLLMLEAIRQPRNDPRSAKRHIHRRLRQLNTEAALIELSDNRAFKFVTLVQKGEPERKSDIVEDLGVFRPDDHRARAHYGRDVAVHECVTREIGNAHHLVDDVAALLVAVMLRLGQHDLHFVVVRQVVERCDDRPSVHLTLVDLLRAVIEARRVAKTDRVGCRKQAERRMRFDHLALIEQREPARCLQYTLDDEHHVRSASIVLVEAERYIVLQCPRQNALAKFGYLLAILDDDGVLADQVDTADVAVEVDAHTRPIEPRRNLFDVRRLAGAVIPGDHNATILREARKDCERGWAVKTVVAVDIGYVLISLRIGGHFQITVDPENLPNRHFHVGQDGTLLHCDGH